MKRFESRKVSSFFLILLLILPLLGGCTQVSQEQREPSDITPLLWRVTSPEGQTIYLFGSIHFGTEDMYPMPTAIMDAFHSSDYLAVESNIREVNVHDNRHTMTLLLYGDEKTIVDEIGEELYQRAREVLVENGMEPWLEQDAIYPGRRLEDFRPALWIDLLGPEVSEVSNELGIDWYLMGEAERHRMEILEIESRIEELEVQINFSLPLQIWLLEEALDVDRTVQEWQVILDAWKQGDSQALEQNRLAMLDRMPEDIREEWAYQTFTRRGLRMVEVAEHYLSEGMNVFFVVGSYHVESEGGVVDSLRERGHTVEQILW